METRQATGTAYGRFDLAFLPVLAASPGSITASQLAERCSNPWARGLVEDWLQDAFERRLVNVRRQADLPADWTLTSKGRRTAKRALRAFGSTSYRA